MRAAALLCAAAAGAAGATAPAPAKPCAGMESAPWCNLKAPFAKRAAALVANLTAKEKAGLLVNGAAAVPRVQWDGYQWWSEALHGLARGTRGVSTSFPQVITTAASFNASLFSAVGAAISTEARGASAGAGKTYWAPNINIFRDPRWGRGQETPGEDPALSSTYAESFVAAFQGSDKKYLKASACLKHFSAYSQETGRGGFPAVVNEQDMKDTYLPAFEAGVKKGKASGIMCSYNGETFGYGLDGNGSQGGAIPSCANKYAMTDLARKTWKFDGYITSDCGAVKGVESSHHYTSSAADTAAATLGAGMDIDCGNFLSAKTLEPLLQNATIAALADGALTHLFTVQMRLGWFDPPAAVPWSGYNRSVVNTKAHQDLALDAAAQGLVLLKNDVVPGYFNKHTLPLEPSADIVAVVGPHALATDVMQGNYHGQAPFLVSPCAGIQAYAPAAKCVVPDGCSVGAGDCWGSEAASAVAVSSAVVVVVGLDQSQEREGHDRSHLRFPGTQAALVDAAAAAAGGKPLIVVVMSGGAVDLSALKNDSRVGAVLWAGYPGQAGGAAVGDALFGKTNKFGKLPMTWYNQSFADAVALADYNMRPAPSSNVSAGTPGRTHRFYTDTPVYPFGYGLSYTQFEHSVALSAPSGDGAVTAAVTVRNVGARGGDEVVVLYARPPLAGQGTRPLRVVVGFARVSVPAGGAATARFAVAALQLDAAAAGGAAGEWTFFTEPAAAPRPAALYTRL